MPAGIDTEIAQVYVPTHQADAVLTQVNPVSTTLYTVLATTANVRIIGIGVRVTWATTQPTPLEVIVTIDGISYVFVKADPVSAVNYQAWLAFYSPEATQFLDAAIGSEADNPRAFLLEGRSVKVEARITWAVTQPTPLVCRVRYAKW